MGNGQSQGSWQSGDSLHPSSVEAGEEVESAAPSGGYESDSSLAAVLQQPWELQGTADNTAWGCEERPMEKAAEGRDGWSGAQSFGASCAEADGLELGRLGEGLAVHH